MTSEQRATARTIIRRYLEQAEANKARIHYSQFRPLTSLGDPPGSRFTTDCSGLVISAYKWADMWTRFLVKDPGGYGYTGIGNTQTILNTNRRRRIPLDRKFFVGDMALFGYYYRGMMVTKHVIICRKNGTAKTAIWTSHGSEAGPYAVYLHYRSDLLCVVRSETLA